MQKLKFNDSIAKPEELWKALKSLDLPDKTSVCGTNTFKVNNTMSFETKSTFGITFIYLLTTFR